MENKDLYEEENEADRSYPLSLRCSDGAAIPETARNWGKYLREPERFQRVYIERVKRYLNKSEKDL